MTDKAKQFLASCNAAREIFLACGEEYAGLRRIFTEEQMEQLREIW